MDAQLAEGPVVDQQRQSLAGGQLLARVLLVDLLLATAELRALAPLLEILDERAQQ